MKCKYCGREIYGVVIYDHDLNLETGELIINSLHMECVEKYFKYLELQS